MLIASLRRDLAGSLPAEDLAGSLPAEDLAGSLPAKDLVGNRPVGKAAVEGRQIP